METKNNGEDIFIGDDFKQNCGFKTIICGLLIFSLILSLSGGVNAYSGGGGTCSCGDGTTTLGGSATDACVDCTAALNDNTNCSNQVNYVGILAINNYSGTCINNPATFTNKTFDCQGHTIDGDDSGYDYGIYLDGKNWNTIKNCIITDFYHGVYLQSSSNNNQLTNNTANSNTNYGIYLGYSSNNKIINNMVNENTGDGIYLNYSSNNTIINNNIISNSLTGIYLWSEHDDRAYNNTIINNNINSNNGDGIYLDSDDWYVGGPYDTSIINNTISLNGGAGIFVWYSSGTTNIINNTISSNNDPGVYLHEAACGSKIIINNTISSNCAGCCDGPPRLCDCAGISLDGGIDAWGPATIINNTINSNNNDGISAYSYFINGIINNTISSNMDDGISLTGEILGAPIINNIISSNMGDGVYLGLYEGGASIENNIINSNSGNGVYLYYYYADGFTAIINNKISNNNIGIYSKNSKSTINSNIVCNNTDLDFNSSDWLSSSGDNNTCNKPDGWNDIGTTGCTYTCQATCGCAGATQTFVCGDTVTESCTLNCDLTSTGTCFTIGADGIVIDGAGYSIHGNTSGNGIYADGRNNNIIRNFIITGFQYGIKSIGFDNTFSNINASSNGGGGESDYGYGIYSLGSNITFSNINASSNYGGFGGQLSWYGGDGYGIYSLGSNITFSNITAYSNRGGAGSPAAGDGGSGYGISSSGSNITFSNINASYNHGGNSDMLHSSRGYGIYSSGSNVTFSNINASSNVGGGGFPQPGGYGYGIYSSGNNNIFSNINASFNRGGYSQSEGGEGYGIYSSGHNNTFSNINASSNRGGDGSIDGYGIGIYLYSSSSNILTSNTANNNYGIYLGYSSHYNDLINNKVENNANDGVYFDSSANNNNLTSNFICRNGLDINDSDSNSGDYNTCDTAYNWNDTTNGNPCTYSCEKPGYKVYVDPSNSSVFINDTFEINITVSGVDVTGVEFKLLFNNTILNATNMTLGPFLPNFGPVLTIPYPPSEGINNSIGEIMLSSVLTSGYASGTDATAIITFKAKSDGSSLLDLQNVTLTNRTFDPVAGVVITDGNVIVQSCMKGDLDCDSDIDFLDFVRFARAYGKTCADLGYNPLADFDSDCDIDFLDFVRFARVY